MPAILLAPYCVPCREEFAILKKNKDELKKRGILVYLIDVGEDIVLDSNLQALGILKGKMGSNFPQVLWGEL